MTTQVTNAPFPKAFAELKARAGLTFRGMADRTRQVDPTGRGLTNSYLVRLANGLEPLAPSAVRLIAAVFEEIDGPEYFVEYRMAQLRDSFDPRHGDADEAIRRFLAWEALPENQRQLILRAQR